MKAIRKTLSLLVIAALMLSICFAASLILSEDAHAAVSKAAVKKAKKYKKAKKKLFKVKGAWYCFSKKKVRKGLQKVGSKYYFFSKSTGKMYLKTGLKKVGTAYYYFKKSSGKAPAYTKKSWKDASGKVWFFKSNGKRYPYSYKNTGSTSGNTAAGYIISEAKIKANGSGTAAQLQAAYKKIVKRSSYQIVLANKITSASTIGSYALTCAKKKGGKCYNMAALTFVTFKALGSNPTLVNGLCTKNGDVKKNQEHAWVEESKLVYDSVFDLSKKEMAFMGIAKEELHGKDYKNKEFKLSGVASGYADYMYTPDKQYTFK